MLLKLIRRDHVIHYGPLWLPLAAPIGVILAAFGREGITPRAEGDYVGPVVLIWILVTLMLGFAQVGLRADSLRVSLPLATRTVWLARLIAVFALVISMVAVAAIFMVAFNDREHEPLVHGDAVAFLISLVAVVALGVALVQSVRPTLREVPAQRWSISYLVVVWAACLALLFILASVGPLWSVLPFAAAGVLFVRVWRRLPNSFTSLRTGPAIADVDVEQHRPPETSTVSALKSVSVVSPGLPSAVEWRWLWTRTILQSLYRPVAAAVVVGIVLVFLGFYVSGFYPEPLSGPVYLFWVIGLSPVFIVWPAKHVFRLDYLPVSRRWIFPFMTLPAIGLIWLGFVGGTVVGNVFSPHPPLREYVGTRECPFCPRVPDRFLEIAWDGRPPAITAPWGETHQPWTCRPIAGRRALLYSPFSIPAGSSKEFVAWQLSREIDAVYGVEVSKKEIVDGFDRYFETRGDGTYKLVSWGDPLRSDFGGLRLRDWGRPTATIVLILGVVWFLVAAWVIRSFYTGVSPTFFSLLGRVLPITVPIGFVAVIVWLGEYGYTSSWKLTALANALIRGLADTLPANPLALWGVVIAVLGGFYFLAETAFRRAQISLKYGDK
jgi:hypothetical protein